MIFDCAIIGAGPAGLNAALVLGRARRSVALFDNGTNRNRVTLESHGYLTRDGIKPAEFKRIGFQELERYPSVQLVAGTINQVMKQQRHDRFHIVTSGDKEYIAERIILATGVQEEHPSVPEIENYYGISLHSCPYCDGWERRDQALIVIAEKEKSVLHLTKLVFNWSKDLLVATNGKTLSAFAIAELRKRDIEVVMEPIKKLHGKEGYLQKVEFASGLIRDREGGFISPKFYRSNPFLEQLGCELKDNEAVEMDALGRTSQKNIYVAGEYGQLSPSALILSAADGFNAAVAVNTDITEERF
nr:NAD(P)/FAD-dependent oxidoreductase [Shimazuella soli]